jgi:alkaline phosphatase D
MRVPGPLRQCLFLSIALAAAACRPGVVGPEVGTGPVNPVGSAGRSDDAGREASGSAGTAVGGSGGGGGNGSGVGGSGVGGSGVGGSGGGGGNGSGVAESGAAGVGGASAGVPGGAAGSRGAPPPDAAARPDLGSPIDVGPAVDAGTLVERVAFGSCNDLTKSQGFWSYVVGQKPQVFLFLGDNAYLDYGDTYPQLGAEPGFQRLLEIARPVVIWDDHDYGLNNGGAAFSGKVASKKRFVDFWGPLGAIPAGSPRRTREGNYDSVVMGPVGRQIQFIMLDVRYFKGVAPSGTVLGPAQWQWLADELRRPAEIRIIMSGIEVVGSSTSSEGWAQFPQEQQNLYDVIKASQARGVLIVSGDKHYAEISRRDVGLGYPLYDFTASALNASNSYAPQANLYRDTPTAANQAHNFGFLTIDWAAADRPIAFQIFNAETGVVLMTKDLTLTALAPP